MVDIAPASVWHTACLLYMSFGVWRPGVDDYGCPWGMGDYVSCCIDSITVYLCFTYGGHFCI